MRRRRARDGAAATPQPRRRRRRRGLIAATPQRPRAVRSAAACATLIARDAARARHRSGERREGGSASSTRVRALAAAGSDPILVVPTAPDALAFRRELAAGGLVFGVRVETFSAPAARDRARAPASGQARRSDDRPPARRRRRRSRRRALAGARRVGRDAGLRARRSPACATSSPRRGSARASGTRRCAPGARREPERAAYAEELAALYGAYRDRRRRGSGGDPATRDYELQRRAAPGARAPGARRRSLFYGFDDLTPTQLDAVRTLAAIGAEVVVSLPYEDGRDDIYRARSRTLGELLELAGERHVRAAAHGEPRSVAALGQLERALFTRRARARRTRATP